MSRPDPGHLPHQVPLFPGETLTSYVRRTADSNYIDVEATDKAFREQGYFKSHAPNDELRRQTWVAYTGLPEDSFTEPIHLGGEAVTERTMCTECTGGEIVRARNSDVGSICLEHSRWIDNPDFVFASDSPWLAAERFFRTYLVPRGVLHDSLAMRFGATCAAVVHDEWELQGLDMHSMDKATYVNTVNMATLLTSQDFLHQVLFHHLSEGNAIEYIYSLASKCLEVDIDDERLPRAVNRISAVTCKLAKFVKGQRTQISPHGQADELNLFRFLDTIELIEIIVKANQLRLDCRNEIESIA